MNRFVRCVRDATRVTIVAAALVGAALPQPLAAQPTTQNAWRTRVAALLRDTVLANGLTVVVAENHTVPLTTVEVAFRSGAVAQAEGEEGLAHVAEHVLFRAYGADQAFATDIADINATYNGTTDDESVNYFITTPSKSTATALKILARLVREPKFNDDDLQAERRIVFNELARAESDATSVLQTELGIRTWGREWSHKDAGGTAASVGAVTLSRLRAMVAAEYVPRNAIVVVSGDVRAADALAEVVRRFADWKGGEAPTRAALAPAATLTTSHRSAVSSRDERLITVALQWPGPSVRSTPREAAAGDVFAAMASSDLSPALQRLVSGGTLHSFRVQSETRDRRGTFTVTAVITPDALDVAVAALRDEVARFSTAAYLNDDLLAAGKRRVAVTAEGWLETDASLAHTVGFWWSVATLDYLRGYGDMVTAVDRAAVEAFVSTYVKGRPFVVVGLSGPAQSDRVQRALAIFAADGAR
jgi:zinc protease